MSTCLAASLTCIVSTLCVSAWLCASVSAADRSHLSQDARVNQARALMHDGDYRAALTILRPLADPARADITDIRFLIGLSAITASQQSRVDTEEDVLLREAIAALRAILINHPHLTRVRLELARAFFLNGDDALSQENFERVLAGNPPPVMAVNIRRFLYTLRARRRWSGYLSFNIEQNDNINRGSDNRTVYLFGLPFVLNERSRPRSAVGLSFSAGGDYQYPISARWRWRFGVDVTRSEYERREFDQNYLLLRGGPRWLLSQRSEVSLQGIGAQRWLAGKRYSYEFGMRLNARHQFTPRLGVNGQVSWIATRYRQFPELAEIDADYDTNATWLFSPLVQGTVGIGWAEESLRRGIDNRTGRVNAGLGVIAPWGWTVNGNAEWSRKWHGRKALFSMARQVDRRLVLRGLVLNRWLTAFGFSPQVVVTWEWQRSNAVLDAYRRTRVDMRFVRQF